MADITLSGNTYPIFGSDTVSNPGAPDPTPCPSADVYLGAKAGSVWLTGDADERKRCLISAQRDLNEMPWAGTKTVSNQPLAWPRSGVTYADGTPVDSTVYPIEIVKAEYELAYVYLTSPKSLDPSKGGPGNVKRLKADTAEIEYFMPVDMTDLPRPILNLVNAFRGGASLDAGATEDFGTCGESEFDDSDRYTVQ